MKPTLNPDKLVKKDKVNILASLDVECRNTCIVPRR